MINNSNIQKSTFKSNSISTVQNCLYFNSDNGSDSSEFHLAKLPDDKEIVKAACLDKDIVALTSDGQVYIHSFSSNHWLPISGLDKNEKICDIEVSEVNVFVITETFKTYAVSTYNSWGQLGTGNRTSDFSTSHTASSVKMSRVQKPSKGIRFEEVASGYGHSYFLTAGTRCLYGAGNTELAQMSLCGKNPSDSNQIRGDWDLPKEIVEFSGKRVKMMASGYAFMLLQLDNDEAYVFGSNDYQQLGVAGPEKVFQPLPVVLPNNNTAIKKMSAGQWVSMIITHSNEVFVTGNLGEQKRYNGWTKLNLSEYGLSPSLLFDGYILGNNLYLLTDGKFSHVTDL